MNQSNTEEKRHDKTDQSLNDSNLTANNSTQFNQQNYYGEQVVFEYPAFSNEERLLIGMESYEYLVSYIFLAINLVRTALGGTFFSFFGSYPGIS